MQEVESCTQEEALKYITEKKCGYISVLKGEIGSDMVDGFKAMGFIRCGISSASETTWAVTDSAKEFLKIYNPPSRWHRMTGSILRAVGAI